MGHAHHDVVNLPRLREVDLHATPQAWRKKDFPVNEVRRFLEPGPVVLLSTAWKGERNIMALGWHMVMEFQPSLLGCFITPGNHSYEMLRRSKECVINIPTYELLDKVVGIGNCSGENVDKFRNFELTAEPAREVSAPLIAECYANIECRLVDTRMLKKYGLFILEAVKAHAPTTPKYPQTIHYRGDGIFMVAGPSISRRHKFNPEML